MKLRLKRDSIRLRLTPSETARLVDSGRVEESVMFGSDSSARLLFAVATAVGRESPYATFTGGVVEVVLPAAEAARWQASEEVALTGDFTNAHGATTRILVEKDFACLKPRPGEDDDCYANPLAATTRA